jgi:hypothetical protein
MRLRKTKRVRARTVSGPDFRFRSEADISRARNHVCFGPLADMKSRRRHVHFSPEAKNESEDIRNAVRARIVFKWTPAGTVVAKY